VADFTAKNWVFVYHLLGFHLVFGEVGVKVGLKGIILEAGGVGVGVKWVEL
jgi:hypothetical protein